MKPISILFIITAYILLHSPELGAQQIRGRVLDENSIPIAGAAVYFDGTTMGVSTNGNGLFTLSSHRSTSASLMVSFMGYELYAIQNPFDTLFHEVRLTPKPLRIKEVVVMRDPFTREQKMKAFKREFFGKNRAGRSCYIENEEDLDLHYSYADKKLIASSEKPLRIVNPYLGYRIDFNLVDFYIKYNLSTLKEAYLASSMFLATTLFTDISDGNTKQKKRRESSYRGSQLNFFRDMAQNRWGKDGFLIFSGSFPISPSSAFAINDTLGIKKVTVLPDSNSPKVLLPNGKILSYFPRTFSLLYNNRDQSLVKFQTPEFFIDDIGNNSHPDLIFFGGDMGLRRVGNLLPLDYGL